MLESLAGSIPLSTLRFPSIAAVASSENPYPLSAAAISASIPVSCPVSFMASFSQNPKRALTICETSRTPITKARTPAITPAMGAAALAVAVPTVAVEAALPAALAARPAGAAAASAVPACAAAWLLPTASLAAAAFLAFFAFDAAEDAEASWAPADFEARARRIRDATRLAESDLSYALPIPSNSGVSSSSSTAAPAPASTAPILKMPAVVGEGLPDFAEGRPTPLSSAMVSLEALPLE